MVKSPVSLAVCLGARRCHLRLHGEVLVGDVAELDVAVLGDRGRRKVQRTH